MPEKYHDHPLWEAFVEAAEAQGIDLENEDSFRLFEAGAMAGGMVKCTVRANGKHVFLSPLGEVEVSQVGPGTKITVGEGLALAQHLSHALGAECVICSES